MSELDYNLNDVITGKLPESINLPLAEGNSRGFQNSFTEGIDPSVIGTGEIGDQISNVGRDRKIVVVKPGDNIQNAINALVERGGGTVSLLNGTHDVNYDITLHSSV